MLQYTFYPCDAAGNKNPAMAVSVEAAGVEAAIQVMVNTGANSFVVCATGTPDVQVKPAAPIGGFGWDLWSNEVRETENPFDSLADALLDAVDVCDEYIDEHADWS